MATGVEIQGLADLMAKLKELASPQQQATTLRAAVRVAMNKVKSKAEANIAKLSPGKASMHKTYKGRLVAAGFAARNVRVKVVLSKDKEAAFARVGVAPEAYYALQFHELGTALIPKNPWLVPAFESSQAQVIDDIRETLAKRIKRIAAKKGGAK